MKEKEGKSLKKELLGYLGTVVAAVGIVIAFHLLGFNVVKIEGESMLPTLEGGDKVVTSNFNYDPKVGDVIVFNATYANKLYVKRIIGTEGQTVEIDDTSGNVYVDGRLLVDEFSIGKSTIDSTVSYPYKIPKGEYFVLGDNRNNSEDSRNKNLGTVKKEDIIGAVKMRLWPLNRVGGVE